MILQVAASSQCSWCFVSLQEGIWDDADGEFTDVIPSSQSDR